MRSLIALIVALLPSVTLADESGPCRRPELEWERWRENVRRANPGVEFGEIVGRQRVNVIDAYNAGGNPGRFDPDRVVLFYCADRGDVLLVFVRRSCVTMAEDMPFADLFSLVSGGLPN